MNPNKLRIKEHLQAFNFKALFREELGWDNPKSRPFTIDYQGQPFTLTPLAEKRGVQILLCSPNEQGHIPDDKTLKQIDRQVEEYAREHVLIFMDQTKACQTWLWARHEYNKSTAYRIRKLRKGQSSELLAQSLLSLAIELEQEPTLTQPEVASKLKKGFDVEKITKKFYDRFKKEHAVFLGFIQGIPVQGDREWYTSVMLNRLMFIYFIQRQGFLGTKSKHTLDGETDYLRQRLKMTQELNGPDTFHSFYRYFLLRLFHEGLNARERTPELERLLGNVPYLNGGIFDIHQLEHNYPNIQIPDEAFERIFDFFDEFTWHLDDRSDKAGDEINPDVLGYIFEKYINQKQMGAYYTKEDITEYISKNTIIPFIFEAAEKQCPIAFNPGGPVWSLLCDNPDDYIHEALAKGTELPLPPEIEAGIADISQRTEWNKAAVEQYALPTEIWREAVERRKRYEEVREKIVTGAITSINDLITYNLDIRQFAQDVITYCEGPDLLLAFYESIEKVTVLDPTCGSGAFLFAALNILKPLYEACLARMQNFVDERDQLDKPVEPHKRKKYYHIERFRDILKQVARHHSREYFILKSIIINNLYGVDIMEEAIEICKLRLFLKLVAQVEKPDDIEPLPDIDFNVLAGNTLVGFTSLDEVRNAVGKDLYMQAAADEILQRIEQKAKELERAVEHFRTIQTTYEIELERTTSAEYKQEVRNKLDALCSELDPYLAMEYGIDRNNIPGEQQYQQKYEQWLKNHQPFHWFVEFYGIMQRGGFDVIIGNPPYVEYNKVRGTYTIKGYQSESCENLYAYVIERAQKLQYTKKQCGMIVPAGLLGLDEVRDLRRILIKQPSIHWLSTFAIRPSKLFEGVDQRLCIHLMSTYNSDENARLYTTRYHHWYVEERSALFALLDYCLSKNYLGLDRIPQIGNNDAAGVLSKLQLKQKKCTFNFYSPNHNGFLMHYHRSPRYWIRGMDFEQYFKSPTRERSVHHFRNLYFNQELEGKFIGAILNSSLFFFWFIMIGNGRNITGTDVGQFPVGEILEPIVKEMSPVFDELMQDYKQKSIIRVRKDCEFQEFRPSKSKPIIDEIDRILAKHYGFTDEELDFIINYDIKYRMGRDNGEEGEE